MVFSKFRQAFGAFIRKSSSAFDSGRFHFNLSGSSPSGHTHSKKVTLVIIVLHCTAFANSNLINTRFI